MTASVQHTCFEQPKSMAQMKEETKDRS